MKPTGPVARRSDYTIRDAPLHEAAFFIRAHHYAKGCSHTAVYAHGLYKGDQIVGAALWLPPTKPCARTVHSDWRRVLSLSRLAIHPDEPQNAASILIGGSIRRIRQEGTWAALVTFADTRMGHTGGIYKATNWTYVGMSAATECWVDADGRQVAQQSTKTRTKAEMMALGYRSIGRFRKHKYTMVLEADPVSKAA